MVPAFACKMWGKVQRIWGAPPFMVAPIAPVDFPGVKPHGCCGSSFLLSVGSRESTAQLPGSGCEPSRIPRGSVACNLKLLQVASSLIPRFRFGFPHVCLFGFASKLGDPVSVFPLTSVSRSPTTTCLLQKLTEPTSPMLILVRT